MDAVALALAKGYTNSQRIAYEETKAIKWDGDTTGKPAIEVTGLPFGWYKVSGDIPIINAASPVKVKTIVMLPDRNIETVLDNPVVQTATFDGAVLTIIANPNDEAQTSLVFIVSEDCSGDIFGTGEAVSLEKGVYFIFTSDEKTTGYTTYFEYETIHTIDQKYIPPMDSITLNGADGKQYKLYVDESGELVTEAIE